MLVKLSVCPFFNLSICQLFLTHAQYSKQQHRRSSLTCLQVLRLLFVAV